MTVYCILDLIISQRENHMDKGLITHAVIINNNREVLIIRRSPDEDVLPGIWDIPGGTLHNGEDPEDGAIRETLEETGLKIHGLSLFHYTSNVDEEKGKQFIRLLFLAKYDDGEVQLDPKDHDEYRWIPVDQPTDYPEMVDYLSDTLKVARSL